MKRIESVQLCQQRRPFSVKSVSQGSRDSFPFWDMYSPEPEPSRKRRRTDAVTSPRSPKRLATDSSSSSSVTETDIDEEEWENFNRPDQDVLTVVVDDDDDQPLQYIDLPPESAPDSTSTSTPSLPQSQSQSPSPPAAPVLGPSQPRGKRTPVSTTQQPDFLSEYTCSICFSPPTNATLTPCGHICCGSCMFTAVKTTLHRAAIGLGQEPNVSRCPVCRAPIPGWDDRGGGVIGLKTRVVISL